MSDRVSVMMAAMAVSLSARTDGLTTHAVEDMRVRAEELLAKDDPLRPAIISFATMFEEHRRDADAIKALGRSLGREIDTALNPATPPLRHRRDLDD